MMTQNLEQYNSPIEEQQTVIAPARAFPVWSGWDILFLLAFVSFSVLMLAALGESVKHLIQTKAPGIRWLVQWHEGIYLILFQALLDIVILLFIYFTITLKYNAAFLQSMKWQPKGNIQARRYVPIGVVLALAVVAASAVLPSPVEPPIEKLLKAPLTATLFATLGVVLAPFVEEIMFRGFIYPVVERWLGRAAAVLATALLFSGVHVSQLWGSWPAIVLITVVGFTLSLARARTDALLPSFIIHLSYNSTMCLLFLIGLLFDGLPVR
jgi:membrane protease YdiL (CAAX protease family)